MYLMCLWCDKNSRHLDNYHSGCHETNAPHCSQTRDVMSLVMNRFGICLHQIVGYVSVKILIVYAILYRNKLLPFTNLFDRVLTDKLLQSFLLVFQTPIKEAKTARAVYRHVFSTVCFIHQIGHAIGRKQLSSNGSSVVV